MKENGINWDLKLDFRGKTFTLDFQTLTRIECF